MEKWDGEYKVVFENEYFYIFLHSVHIFEDKTVIFFLRFMNKCDFDLRKKTRSIIENGNPVEFSPRGRYQNYKLIPGKLEALTVMIDYDRNRDDMVGYKQEFEMYIDKPRKLLSDVNIDIQYDVNFGEYEIDVKCHNVTIN